LILFVSVGATQLQRTPMPVREFIGPAAFRFALSGDNADLFVLARTGQISKTVANPPQQSDSRRRRMVYGGGFSKMKLPVPGDFGFQTRVSGASQSVSANWSEHSST
jgi:hypothetical protein